MAARSRRSERATCYLCGPNPNSTVGQFRLRFHEPGVKVDLSQAQQDVNVIPAPDS